MNRIRIRFRLLKHMNFRFPFTNSQRIPLSLANFWSVNEITLDDVILLRDQADGGRESSKDVHRASVTDLRPDTTGSILDTLRTSYGDPEPVSQATADDQVIVNGMEISLNVAEQLGFVQKDANGNYYDPKLGVPGTDRYYQQVEQHREEKAEQAESSTANALRSVDSSHSAYLGDEAEQTLATLVRADASLAGDLVSSAINALAHGEQPSFSLQRHCCCPGQGRQRGCWSGCGRQGGDCAQRAGSFDLHGRWRV